MEQPELNGEDSASVMLEYEYVFAFIFVHSVIVLEDVAGLSSSMTMNGHSSFSQLLMLILPLLSKAKRKLFLRKIFCCCDSALRFAKKILTTGEIPITKPVNVFQVQNGSDSLRPHFSQYQNLDHLPLFISGKSYAISQLQVLG